MDDLYYVYGTAALIALAVALGAFRKSFDPFAPIWLFLAGYAQVYVVQALSFREYALRVRGVDLVGRADFRAFWALAWFLVVYHCGLPSVLARRLPRPAAHWSPGLIAFLAPWMILWGLVCSGIEIVARRTEVMSAEESLFLQFAILMLVAAILLIVTGRRPEQPRPALTAIGLGVAALYVLIWMFNGKRSHSLFGVLTAVCAFYVSRGKRPSKLVLAATAFCGALVVSLAIGWRDNLRYERSLSGFSQYVSEFRLSSILVNLNVKDKDDIMRKKPRPISYETEEYGGFLLMMDTVPAKAEHDYGASYIRLVSTYIPRILWRDKPLFGREQWVNAWIAGSEFKRKADFTGPAIGILGATQLNGGAYGTLIVLAVIALMIRAAYEYFRLYSTVAWVQAWWSLTFYNAWMMTVNDDPFVWFYYLYGHTTLPPLAFVFVYNRMAGRAAGPVGLRGWGGGGGVHAVES
jgi:hypothetical protein